MSFVKKYPGLVGKYIKRKREASSLSQRALGLLFEPPVTTQFISNLERGVTPLPPIHVSMLVKALNLPQEDLFELMEREYAVRLSGKLGRETQSEQSAQTNTTIHVKSEDYIFIKDFYDSYKIADSKTKAAFLTIFESMFGVKKQ